MSDNDELIGIFQSAREWLARPQNDFAWSSWTDAGQALREIDEIVATLRAGVRLDFHRMRLLFAPTGPIQEVSLSSGWGEAFLELAAAFDAAFDRVLASER